MSFKVFCDNCRSEIIFRNNFEGVGTENIIEIYSTMDERIVI